MRHPATAVLGLGLGLAVGLAARPSNIDGNGQSCASCHSVNGSAVVTFLSVNGAPVGTSVSAVPDQVLGVVWRVQGLSGGSAIGAFVQPTGPKANFLAATGPTWSDNSRSGATAWANGSSVAWRAALGGAEGQGPDNGGVSDPNGLANNEVFSVSLTVKALSSGTYPVELGAGVNNLGQRYASKLLNIVVVVNSPTPTATPSPTPQLGSPTETPTATPVQSPTASPTPSPSPTETPVLSPTPSATALPTVLVVPDASFTGVLGAGLLTSPIHSGSLRLWLDLAASAEQGEVRVYSSSYTRVATLSLGPLPKGRSQQALALPALAAQPLWVQVLVQREGRWRQGPVLLTYVLP